MKEEKGNYAITKNIKNSLKFGVYPFFCYICRINDYYFNNN